MRTYGNNYNLTLSDIVSTNISAGATATETVYWMWDYSTGSASDTVDTNLGIDGDAIIEVAASVVVTQED